MKKFFVLCVALLIIGTASGAFASYYDEGHSGSKSNPYINRMDTDRIFTF